jgi:hypothetical protein
MEGTLMNKKLCIILFITIVTGSYTLVAEDVIGYIEYIKGDVEITRDGEIYESYDLDEDDDIENFDLIRTSSNGEITIVIDSDSCPETTITVEPDTAFNVEINKLKTKNETTLNMITGNLALKVGELTKNQELDVATEGAVMGVRGTSFGVGASPGGEILVTCDEGEVECKDESGKKLRAVPGEAVEQRPGELFQQIPVKVSDLKKFRREWNTERIEAFKPNALRAIRQYGREYRRLLGTFKRQYQDLMKKEKTIQKWIREKEKGEMGSRMEIMKEKKEVVGVLFRIRRTLFIFERVYFRLLELQNYYKQGYGKGELEHGLSVKKFFMEFNRTSKELHKRVAKVRFIMKLYAKRNDGQFPTDITDEDDGDFFGDDDKDDDFFGDDDF